MWDMETNPDPDPVYANRVIDALNGTSAVAELLKAPTSTVHSWRSIGISAARLDHLKLAARAAGKQIDWDNPPPSPAENKAAAA